MTELESLILGIVQGLTEFLPVSSSGHLEIGSVLLNVETEENLLFAVVVHLATALATVVVFRDDLSYLLRNSLQLKWNDSTKFILLIFVSMIPVFLVGVFLKEEIESFFSGNMLLVGSMLLITSLLLFVAHYQKDGSGQVTVLGAIVIGVAQAFAVLPGISRSGATIATALLLGIERSSAARFSFLMVLVPILGASLLQLKEYMDYPMVHHIGWLPLIIGFGASFLSGFVACKWMLKIVRGGKLTYFALYCLCIGTLAIISSI